MPTRFGFWFGMLLALTVVGGLNFNNNMTLMLGFLLAAIAQLTTLLAYRNLAGIRIDAIRASPVFAEEPACFKVLLKNPEERSRFAIQAESPDGGDCIDISPQASGQLSLNQMTVGRGWLQMAPRAVSRLVSRHSNSKVPDLSQACAPPPGFAENRTRRFRSGQPGRGRSLPRIARVSNR